MYADYIEEHGDGARAEFIRAQVRLAAMNEWDDGYTALDVRCRRLLAEHPEWLEPVREWVAPQGFENGSRHARWYLDRPHSIFRRGFPNAVAASTAWFATEHRALFERFPIEAAGFAMDTAVCREPLLDCSGLGRLTRLDVSMWGEEREGMEALSQLRHVGRLKRFDVYSEATPTESFEKLLLASQFAGIESFSLTSDCSTLDPRQPRDIVCDLDRGSWLFGLRELALDGTVFEGLGERLARESDWAARLKRLRLRGYMGHYGQIAPERVARVGEGLRSGWFRAVEDLDLTWSQFEGLVLDALVASGAARPLRLTLPDRNRDGYQQGLEVAPGFLRTVWCGDLRALELHRPGEAEVGEVLDSALPGRLRVLVLAGGSLTGGRVRALLDATGGWPHLERLDLTGNPIPDGALKEFVALGDRFPRLVSLAVGNGQPAPKFLARLANSPSAAQFRELQLNIPLDTASADVLARSPYLTDIDLISVVEGRASAVAIDRLKDRFGPRLTILPNR